MVPEICRTSCRDGPSACSPRLVLHIVQRPAPVAKSRRSWQPVRHDQEEPSMRLEGKVAIVSGAASGMGAATARRFAKEGAKVVIADMLEEEGRAVAADIVRANGTAEFMKLDVTNETDWKAVVDATVQKFGKLDI